MWLYELLWHPLHITVVSNTVNNLNMMLEKSCLKDKKKSYFYLLSSTFLRVCMHINELHTKVLVPSWLNFINFTNFCSSIWFICLFHFFFPFGFFWPSHIPICTYTKSMFWIVLKWPKDYGAVTVLVLFSSNASLNLIFAECEESSWICCYDHLCRKASLF